MAAKLYSALSISEPNGGGSFYGAVDYQGALGRSLQELGRSAEAQEILMRCLQTERSMVERQPNNPEALYRLAAVESSLGSDRFIHPAFALRCATGLDRLQVFANGSPLRLAQERFPI